MTVTSRWWLALFVLYIMVAVLCYMAEGAYLGTNETTKLNQITNMNGTFSSIGAVYTAITTVVTWNFAFFETGIGIYIKWILLCFSAAIILPFAFDVARLLFKPFGG